MVSSSSTLCWADLVLSSFYWYILALERPIRLCKRLERSISAHWYNYISSSSRRVTLIIECSMIVRRANQQCYMPLSARSSICPSSAQCRSMDLLFILHVCACCPECSHKLPFGHPSGSLWIYPGQHEKYSQWNRIRIENIRGATQGCQKEAVLRRVLGVCATPTRLEC